MQIVVYGKPDCPQCEWTRKILDKMELFYEEIDVTQDPSARRDVEAMGFTQLPVVVASNRFRTLKWSGFKVDKLRGLKSSTGDY